MTKLHNTYVFRFFATLENGKKIDIEIPAQYEAEAVKRAEDRFQLKHVKEYSKPEKVGKCNACFIIDGIGGTRQFFDIRNYSPRNNEFEKECRYALYDGDICRGIFSTKTECKNHARKNYWVWL